MVNTNQVKLSLLFIFIAFSLVASSRLPKNSKPYHYIIKIEPHMIFENSTFNGSVEILLEIFSATRNITLHSSKLAIIEKETVLIDATGKITPRQHIFEDFELLVLNFNSILKPGIYLLKLKFSGLINSGVWDNFYSATGLCRYAHNGNNKTKYFLTTNLQPSFARQVFPCWDEPNFKATFDIAIKHFPNYTVHSNMPVEKKIHETFGGKIWTDFKTTPLMSVHNLAFSITDFEKKIQKENFSIWFENSRFDLSTEILDTGLEVSRILKDYTKITFPLPKIDFIVLPSLDKIENWGLIYVWESSILEKSCSLIENKEAISSLVVPAIIHQWFGNIVSPDWWSDLWIISGLSSYFGYFVKAKVLKIPRLVDFMLIQEIRNNFEKETNSPSLPVYRDVKIPNEIFMEDAVISSKPAVIMHMLSNLISREVFHSGVQKLLQKYKLKTIKTENFWNVMQEALNETRVSDIINIKMVVEPYLSQIGYPVINVFRNYKNGEIKLSQECQVFSRQEFNTTEGKWWIPINFAIGKNLNFTSTFVTHWMNPKNKQVIIKGIDPNDWIILNKQGTGYYRVNYDSTNWKKISDYLNSEKFANIHFMNRARLLQDATWLWQNKKLDTEFFLSLASYLKYESNVIPCLECKHIFNTLYYKIDYEIFTNFTLSLVNTFLNGANFKKEENSELLLKELRRVSLFWKNKLLPNSSN